MADFDGDAARTSSSPVPRAASSTRARAAADFAEGAACAVALGGGRDRRVPGRLGRRRPDRTSSPWPRTRLRLWQNQGGGKFADCFHTQRRADLHLQARRIGGNACDINNDGRQDVFLLYPEMAPQVFFNRGYRSFGHAHKPIDMAETGNLPEAVKGQQAGVLADLNGDGAQDMALVLPTARCASCRRPLTGDSPLACAWPWPRRRACGGPVNVSADNDRRPLGAWAVSPGTGEALFCRTEAGEVTVTWQLPGGQAAEEDLHAGGQAHPLRDRHNRGGPSVTAHAPVDEPLPTIVGPRPERAGGGRIVVPRGMERLLTLAGSSPAWREKDLAVPLEEADEAVIGLSATRRDPGGGPGGALEQMAASFDRRTVRTPVGRTAAGVAAAALLATGLGGRAEAGVPDDVLRGGTRSDVTMLLGIRPDAPNVMSGKADLILLLKIRPADAKDQCSAEVVRALKKPKDKEPGKVQVIDLTKSANVEHAKAVRQMVAAWATARPCSSSARARKTSPSASCTWAASGSAWTRAARTTSGRWTSIHSHMEATWAGGTDMLLRSRPARQVPGHQRARWPAAAVGTSPSSSARSRAGSAPHWPWTWPARASSCSSWPPRAATRSSPRTAKAKKFEEVTARLKLGSKSGRGLGRLQRRRPAGPGLLGRQGADHLVAGRRRHVRLRGGGGACPRTSAWAWPRWTSASRAAPGCSGAGQPARCCWCPDRRRPGSSR